MNEYRQTNRRAWSWLAQNGCESSQPYGPAEFARARDRLDSRNWIHWDGVRSVLCLGCGGGQQAPLFAWLGYKVTVADISPDQLAIDERVAAQNNLSIECVEADMMDLSALHGREFDLVYQAVSACYIPDVRSLYREVSAVLKVGGHYRVEHWNPTHLQLSENYPWDGEAYRIDKPQQSGARVLWPMYSQDHRTPEVTCIHFIHRLHDLMGGLCDAGFAVLRFAESGEADLRAEAGSHRHLAAYLPSFYLLFARRRY